MPHFHCVGPIAAEACGVARSEPIAPDCETRTSNETKPGDDTLAAPCGTTRGQCDYCATSPCVAGWPHRAEDITTGMRLISAAMALPLTMICACSVNGPDGRRSLRSM